MAKLHELLAVETNLENQATKCRTDLINTFEKITGEKLQYEITGRRAGDVVKVYADVAQATEKLGWTAEKSLEEMLSSAWRWELALKHKAQQEHV